MLLLTSEQFCEIFPVFPFGFKALAFKCPQVHCVLATCSAYIGHAGHLCCWWGGACMSIVDLKSKVWKLCANSTEVHRFVNVATISITKSAEVG